MAEKRWHLHEHIADIFDWWYDHTTDYFPNEQELRFLAYERWLNDRELLTIEDEYEWRYALDAKSTDRSPSPTRPTHTVPGLSRIAVDVLAVTERELGVGIIGTPRKENS